METKIYSTKANATRAAKKATPEGADYEVMMEVTGGFTFKVNMPEAPKVAYTSDELAAMGDYGAGDAANPVCQHCGIDHTDNGYTFDGDDVNGSRITLHNGFYSCLACLGEWGPVNKGLAATYNGFKAAGNSMCKSLRLTAETYHGNRKGFICDAMGAGAKEATASANWAAMKRGEF